MSQDITWCGNKDCTFTECRRHQTHILRPNIPHSFAMLENTEDCYKKYQNANNRVEVRHGQTSIPA